MRQMHLAAGLRLDPLGELTAPHRPPSWISGAGVEGTELDSGGRGGMTEGKGEVGEEKRLSHIFGK